MYKYILNEYKSILKQRFIPVEEIQILHVTGMLSVYEYRHTMAPFDSKTDVSITSLLDLHTSLTSCTVSLVSWLVPY